MAGVKGSPSKLCRQSRKFITKCLLLRMLPGTRLRRSPRDAPALMGLVARNLIASTCCKYRATLKFPSSGSAWKSCLVRDISRNGSDNSLVVLAAKRLAADATNSGCFGATTIIWIGPENGKCRRVALAPALPTGVTLLIEEQASPHSPVWNKRSGSATSSASARRGLEYDSWSTDHANASQPH